MDKNILYNLIKGLPSLYYTGGINEKNIFDAEKELSLNFAKDYIFYLTEFGQIEANGIELTGLSQKVTTSVINTTKTLRGISSVPLYMYVIEDLGIDDIYYLQDKDGIIYQFRVGGKPIFYAQSLFEYIENSQNK